MYSTVGRSIADKYDAKHAAEVVCRGYAPPYLLYIIDTVVSVQQMNLLPENVLTVSSGICILK